MKKIHAPSHLTPAGKRLWKDIFEAAEIDIPARPILQILCESWERMTEAREAIARDGMFLTETGDKGQPRVKVHPAVAVERDAKAQVMRAFKSLGFDQQEIPS